MFNRILFSCQFAQVHAYIDRVWWGERPGVFWSSYVVIPRPR